MGANDHRANNPPLSPSQILARVKTVDGAGSGLDADTVDGIEASAFYVDGDDAAGLGSGAAADGYVLTADGAGGAAWEAPTDMTGAEILAALAPVDGGGSGLDADLLDGQHGSYYRNASNLNAGTVPSARMTGALATYVFDPIIATGTLFHNTLSSPTIGEAAIVPHYLANRVFGQEPTAEYSTDNQSSWNAAAFTSDQLLDLVKGYGASLDLERTWTDFRLSWDYLSGWTASYVYLNYLYMYTSTNGNSMRILVERRDAVTLAWSTLLDHSGVSNWPGHLWGPHTTTAFTTGSGRYDRVRITMTPTWSHASNKIRLYGLAWYGSYPQVNGMLGGLIQWDRAGGMLFRDVNPQADSTYDHGGASLRWANGYYDTLHAADIQNNGGAPGFSQGINLGDSDLENYDHDGTFTPTVYGSTTAGTPSYSAQDGDYSRIGNVIIGTLRVALGGSLGGMAGDVRIGGLPIAAAHQTPVTISDVNGITFSAQLTAHIPAGQTYIAIEELVGGSNPSMIGAGALAADAIINISFAYRV